MADSTLERLTTVIADKLAVEPERVELKARFNEDLGADSLDLMELIMAVEEEFELEKIDESELEGLETVGQVLELVKRKLAPVSVP